eukprot:COSAG02_NODE_1458_length_12476_cov_6.772841_1_plen_117_part_10
MTDGHTERQRQRQVVKEGCSCRSFLPHHLHHHQQHHHQHPHQQQQQWPAGSPSQLLLLVDLGEITAEIEAVITERSTQNGATSLSPSPVNCMGATPAPAMPAEGVGYTHWEIQGTAV